MRSITRAWTLRGKGHCNPRSLNVAVSIATISNSAGGEVAPRRSKRVSSVASSASAKTPPKTPAEHQRDGGERREQGEPAEQALDGR